MDGLTNGENRDRIERQERYETIKSLLTEIRDVLVRQEVVYNYDRDRAARTVTVNSTFDPTNPKAVDEAIERIKQVAAQ